MNRTKRFVYSILILTCGGLSTAHAQQNPNGQIAVGTLAEPFLVLMRDPIVHDELRLSTTQRQAVRALADELDMPLWTLRNQSGEPAVQLFRKLNETAESRMNQILAAGQSKRLAQIRLSVSGLPVLLRDDIAEKLKLSEQQRVEIRGILEESDQKETDQSPAGNRPPPPAEKRPAQVAAVLSRDQLTQARDLLGAPLDIAKLGYVKFKAPELDGKDGWLNTEPLTMEQLRGKVVALHFWTFG